MLVERGFALFTQLSLPAELIYGIAATPNTKIGKT